MIALKLLALCFASSSLSWAFGVENAQEDCDSEPGHERIGRHEATKSVAGALSVTLPATSLPSILLPSVSLQMASLPSISLPSTFLSSPESSRAAKVDHAQTWTNSTKLTQELTSETKTVPSSISATPTKMTTITSYISRIQNATHCPPTVTNCLIAPEVTTEIIAIYTTICPVTETESQNGATYEISALPATTFDKTFRIATSQLYSSSARTAQATTHTTMTTTLTVQVTVSPSTSFKAGAPRTPSKTPPDNTTCTECIRTTTVTTSTVYVTKSLLNFSKNLNTTMIERPKSCISCFGTSSSGILSSSICLGSYCPTTVPQAVGSGAGRAVIQTQATFCAVLAMLYLI